MQPIAYSRREVDEYRWPEMQRTNTEAYRRKMFWKLHSNYLLPWVLMLAAGELLDLGAVGLQHLAESLLFARS